MTTAGRTCEHRKDGTSGDPAVSCGKDAAMVVHFHSVNFSVLMCAEHAKATVEDESIGDCSAVDIGSCVGTYEATP